MGDVIFTQLLINVLIIAVAIVFNTDGTAVTRLNYPETIRVHADSNPPHIDICDNSLVSCNDYPKKANSTENERISH